MSASALPERVAAVMDELLVLQREVEALPTFLGKFHAENGLRQARVYASECLHRLPSDVIRDAATTDGAATYGPETDANAYSDHDGATS